ncbi:MAG: peroxiredoxin family protein [Armatimonadota bacterium]
MSAEIGDILPPFALQDPATGETFGTTGLNGSDVLLVFLRGTWCPFCREQLSLLRDRYPQLSSAGIRVVAISCQSAPSIARHLEASPLPFPLLADERREVARAFGVHYRFRWDGVNLAHPSLFIADSSGRITFKHVGRTMSDLPVATILDRFLGFLGNPGSVEGGAA